MADVAFFFEHAKLRTDSRVVQPVRECREHLPDSGSFELVENIHDLAFAASESFGFRFLMIVC